MSVLKHLQRSARAGQSWAVGIHDIPGVKVRPRNGGGGTMQNGFRGPTVGGPYIIPGGGSGFPRSNIDWGGGVQGGLGGLQGGATGNPWVDAAAGFVGGLFQGGGGGGAEPPSGTPTIPGLVTTGSRCPDGTWDVLGKCINKPGGQLRGGGVMISGGEAVLGMYGVAMAPQVEARSHRSCPRGMVLGNDGLCYQRSQLRKNEREHVPPRKPLMTGGDLNAISRAARVARSLERKTKQLQSMGMIKKPTRRAAPRRKC